MYYLFLKKPSIEYSQFARESKNFDGVVMRESRDKKVVDLARLSGSMVFEIEDDFYIHLAMAMPMVKSYATKEMVDDWCHSYLNPLKENLDKLISPCNNKLNK